MKARLLVAALSVGLLSLLTPASSQSQVSVGIGIRVGPPPVRVERMGPPPFAHALWIHGYWLWNGHGYNSAKRRRPMAERPISQGRGYRRDSISRCWFTRRPCRDQVELSSG